MLKKDIINVLEENYVLMFLYLFDSFVGKANLFLKLQISIDPAFK